MRVLFVSGELIGSAICHKLVRDGHDVKLYIERKGWKECLDGIIPKTDDWRNELDWVGKDGLIIFDDIDFGQDQDQLRKEGFTVVGGSLEADKLEANREHFQNVLEAHDIEVLPSIDFTSSSAAIRHIEKNRGTWVVKQNSHFGALNYVGELSDGSDAIAVLQSYQKQKISAHLQKCVKGVEVGVARYFNGRDWVGPIEINHEHKRLCNDDIGPLTPEMGTVMWFSEDENLPLFEKTLKKLKPFLQMADFKGDFDINCIVNEDNIWPLEATARFGAPSTELQSEMLETKWIDFLQAVAGRIKHTPKFSDGYGVVVSVVVPPFPYTKDIISDSIFSKETLQVQFRPDMTDEDMGHIYFEEISKHSETSNHYWSGINGWTMHVTGKGKTIESARENVHKIIDKIILPKKFYRTDIGVRVENQDLPKLKEWGWV